MLLLAEVVELADARDSKSRVRENVRVRPPPSAPNQYNPNPFFPVGDGFGLLLFFDRFEDTHFRNGIVKRPESKPRRAEKEETG